MQFAGTSSAIDQGRRARSSMLCSMGPRGLRCGCDQRGALAEWSVVRIRAQAGRCAVARSQFLCAVVERIANCGFGKHSVRACGRWEKGFLAVKYQCNIT